MYCTRVNSIIRYLAFLVLISYLVGCGPVRTDWNPQDYTVKRGDTLYSIAWRYEKDFRDIASWNNITTPYHIYPGQRLRMAPDSSEGTTGHEPEETLVIETSPSLEEHQPAVAPEKARPAHVTVKKGDTLYSLAREYEIEVKRLARWNWLKPPYRLYPGQKLRLSPPQISSHQPKIVIVSPVKPSSQSPVNKTKPSLPSRVKHWQWPVKGKVVKTFSHKDTDRKGIGISGSKGQAVKAAAAGQVVYSGNGLISYGNLVIIKHSNSFLSAYAHNDRLLVKEGQSVSAGQKIANMGTLDNGRAILHFEIRKNGKPVNPVRYLPRKKS